MRYLLDTHAFLWYFMADPRLSKNAAIIMVDMRNELLLSMASIWEIGIKSSIGKLTLPAPFAILIPQQLQQASIGILEIKLSHVTVGCGLPFHHKDPFDRMLVAQCVAEQIPVLSSDPVLDHYGIKRIW